MRFNGCQFSKKCVFYGAAPYRLREGFSTRAVARSDEIQLRIDSVHADLDDEINGFRRQVRQLRNAAQEIESEATYQNDFLNQFANDADPKLNQA